MAKTKQKRVKTIDVEFTPTNYETTALSRVGGHVAHETTRPLQLPAVQRPNNFVVPIPQQVDRGELTQRQMAGIAGGQQMLHAALQQPARTTHARQDDNAIIIAHSHNIASRPKLIIFGAVVVVLIIGIAVYWQMGARQFVGAVMVGTVVWGGVSLWFLERDRRVALHHSAAGIEHHSIDDHGATSRLAIREFAQLQRDLIRGGTYDDK